MSAGTRRSEFRASRVSAKISAAFEFLSEEDYVDDTEQCEQNGYDHEGDSMPQTEVCYELHHNKDTGSGVIVLDANGKLEAIEPAVNYKGTHQHAVNSDQDGVSEVESVDPGQSSSDTGAPNMNLPSETDCDDLTKSFTKVVCVNVRESDEPRDVKVVMRRQSARQSVRQHTITESNENDDDGDGEDDDDDSGVYDAAYRASTWVKIGCNDNKSWLNHSVDSPVQEDNVFEGEIEESSFEDQRERGLSTATTASESEFRNRYQAITRKVVQRHDSQDAYLKRMTNQYFEAEKLATIEKRPGDEDFGFHVSGSCPVFVSTVTPGGAAAAAGVKEGDAIVCINGQCVMATTHEEVVAILKKDSCSQRVSLGLTPRPDKPANHFKDVSQPVIFGTLLKRSITGLVKTWKKRWCVLKQDNCLYVFKEECDHSPLAAIPLKNYTITKATNAGKDFAFRISRYGADTYYFAASSKEEFLSWTEVIREASKSDNNGMDYWLDISSHHINMPALSIRDVDCHGYLTKMGGHYKSWKKRFCVLKDACLYYYVESMSSKAKGLFHLHGYSVIDAPEMKKHGFKLVPPNESLRTFCFYADFDKDKERWMVAMRKSIAKWVVADL